MPFLQRDYWLCPFCDKGIIEVLIKPSTMSAKRTACRAGRSTTWHKSKEEIIVLSNNCPHCGKSKEEIEKKWRSEGTI